MFPDCLFSLTQVINVVKQSLFILSYFLRCKEPFELLQNNTTLL